MTGKRRRFLSAREQCEMLAPWRGTLPRMAADDNRGDENFEWDDEDEDDGPPAPPGVWTPPRYDEDGNYGPTGGMYGTHDERYLEDVFHGHLVDLTDQESIDAYEHQRTKPKFKGSGLEDTMWTNIANRYEGSGEHDDINEEGDEDFGHPKIVDYFNKVHGCDEHIWKPPDLHEPHGNFGDHPEGWDPDDDQDPFDPRLIGASRTAAMGELNWKPEGEGWLDHPDENDSIQSAQGDDDWQHTYHVLAPWRHDAMAVNGFGERVDSEQPHMWGLVHRFDPDNGFWDHAVTYHPTEDHAKGAAEHHHITGDAPGRWPGTVPSSDYDADHVESWPDIAENVDRDREEDDDGRPEEEWGDPEAPLNRGNGLKWRYYNYWKDRAPSYMAEYPENAHHPATMPGEDDFVEYEVQGPHGPDNGLAHPEGSYSVRWKAPGWQGDRPKGYMTGEYQSNLSGRGYHPTLEDAMRWAENHANPGASDPDENPDPDDPRIKGANRGGRPR